MSWIEDFISYTSAGTSPRIFTKWAAIAAVAGALERRVWVRTKKSNLYPNLYIILVGPPGVGKTELTKDVFKLWSGLDGHFIAASNVTAAGIIDELREAKRVNLKTGDEYNSLKICSNELSVLLPTYDTTMMGKLTDIYDGHPYSEKRRGGEGKNTFSIAHPQIMLLAATTPGQMTSTIPEGAWDQGFMSRTLLVFSSEIRRQSLFADDAQDGEQWDKLMEGFKHLGEIEGKFIFTAEAAARIDEWQLGGGSPAPTHPKLYHYLTRRTAHVLKLMMVSCADRMEGMIITEEDFDRALSWLLEAEQAMPEIFRSMTPSGDGTVIADIWHAVFIYNKTKKQGLPRATLYALLQNKVPAYKIESIIGAMVEADQIKKIVTVGSGISYIPGSAAANQY
jgi:hypothetical protein